MLHLISLDTPLPCTEQLPGNERGANLTFAASHHQEQAPPEAAWQAQDQQQQWRFGLSRFGWGWCADRIRRSAVLAPPPARMRLHAIHRGRELQQATRVQHPPARPTGTSAPPSALSTTSSPSSGNSPTSQPSSAASSTPTVRQLHSGRPGSRPRRSCWAWFYCGCEAGLWRGSAPSRRGWKRRGID